MKDAANLDKIRLYGFDPQGSGSIVHNIGAMIDAAETPNTDDDADYISAAEAFAEFVGMTIEVDALKIVHDEQEQEQELEHGLDQDHGQEQGHWRDGDYHADSNMDDLQSQAQRPPIPPLRPGPEPIRPPVHPVHPGPEPIRPPILRPPVPPVHPGPEPIRPPILRPPVQPVRPHPMPTPTPIPRPPSGSAPRFAPPAFIPQAAPGLRAVDPGAIANCLYSFTYLWLSNRNQFWFFPTFVGRRSVAGYRWIRGSWVFMGFDLRLIDSFFCGGR